MQALHPHKDQRFGTYFDSYVRAYEERFEPRSGSLRPVVVRSVEEYPGCGCLEGGFARARCPNCRTEHFLASRESQARYIARPALAMDALQKEGCENSTLVTLFRYNIDGCGPHG
jgi:hypothetical protein